MYLITIIIIYIKYTENVITNKKRKKLYPNVFEKMYPHMATIQSKWSSQTSKTV